MSLKIALILSVILQFAAAAIALSLVKRTRTNIAWWLISAGFLLMAIRRVFEVVQVFQVDSNLNNSLASSWIAVIISLIMLMSLVFIKRIFNIQSQIDKLRRQNESRVLSAIIKTEEHERQYFSKELHDGLGPLLASVKMALSACSSERNQNPEIMANAEKLIDESIGTLKDISNKLSPHVLNDYGLLKALRSFINKLPLPDGPLIKMNSNLDEKRFPYNVEVVLYRVICELITNTLKHARAHNIFIDLMADEQAISLRYIDDGIGFDTAANIENVKGLGYRNMESRVKSLDGSFIVYSKPDEGVNITISINLTRHE